MRFRKIRPTHTPRSTTTQRHPALHIILHNRAAQITTIMAEISLFKHIKDTVPQSAIDMDLFLDAIKNGMWESVFYKYKAGAITKTDAPCVTMSGTFSGRKDALLVQHSGFICIDIDKCDVDEVKSLLSPDPYVYAIFSSISGAGVAVVFKINGNNHRDMFTSISEYLYDKYRIICDASCINVSRARFVSYDSNMWLNTLAKKYAIPPMVKESKRRVSNTIHLSAQFEKILDELESKAIDITFNYSDWLRVGFAISSEYGENGREYFHRVSNVSSKYQPHECDKQYDNCLRAKRSGVNIGTFYYYVKEAGIQIISESVKKLASSLSNNKKAGLTKQVAIQTAMQFSGETDEALIENIANQIYDKDINFESDKCLGDQLEEWLLQTYNLRKNEITRYIEIGEKQIDKFELNDIFRLAKKIFPKLTYELMDRTIHSKFIREYNPLFDFFRDHQDLLPAASGTIDRYFGAINSGSKKDYTVYFGKKWLVSAIAAAHGHHSPLLLVLCGTQNSGKTEFFRRLLPKSLYEKFFAESKLDAGKDDEILMTQKWFIFDDEMGGKSKKDTKKLKEYLSKQYFTLREPYGSGNVTLRRLAILCGSTNDEEILFDPTGNRRIIPIGVQSLDFAVLDTIDRTALIMDAYQHYRDGFDYQLSKSDIELLNSSTSRFEAINLEYDLIMTHFSAPDTTNQYSAVYMTMPEIKQKLELFTKTILNVNKLGQELKRIGIERKYITIRGQKTARVWAYFIIDYGGSNPLTSAALNSERQVTDGNPALFTNEPLPF